MQAELTHIAVKKEDRARLVDYSRARGMKIYEAAGRAIEKLTHKKKEVIRK